MPYCVLQNLIDRFGEVELVQITDYEQSNAINMTVLNQAISDADAEINGYLTAYVLPLESIPANLVRIASDITRFYLYKDLPTDVVKLRYDNAIKYLMQVGKGVISLAPNNSGVIAVEEESPVKIVSYPSVFNRDG